jgi:hypothetical protein
LPEWGDVAGREYHVWDREHIVIDTARLSIAESIAMIRASLARI